MSAKHDNINDRHRRGPKSFYRHNVELRDIFLSTKRTRIPNSCFVFPFPALESTRLYYRLGFKRVILENWTTVGYCGIEKGERSEENHKISDRFDWDRTTTCT